MPKPAAKSPMARLLSNGLPKKPSDAAATSSPAVRPNTQIRTTREAVGVAALITPWNFPVAMITRKAAPALAAGCAVVVKPAKQTPLCAVALAELAMQAGVPPGAFNLVCGNAQSIGGELCANPKVRALSFTGSTEVGRLLAAQCAPTVKKVSLELGGNAPFIVFDDADLPRAVRQLIVCKFRNAGQTCVCANRVYVQKNGPQRICVAVENGGGCLAGCRRLAGRRGHWPAD